MLLGTYDDAQALGSDRSDWPIALSRKLGVRIYETAA